MGQGDTLQNAVIGAIATTVFYFIPVVQAVAPIAGGVVAGYLQGEGAGGGMKVGALKGLIMFIPGIAIGTVAAGLLAGIPVIGGLLAGSLIVIVIVIVIHSVVLGLVGGLIGGILS
jgi:hypothetical protein